MSEAHQQPATSSATDSCPQDHRANIPNVKSNAMSSEPKRYTEIPKVPPFWIEDVHKALRMLVEGTKNESLQADKSIEKFVSLAEGWCAAHITNGADPVVAMVSILAPFLAIHPFGLLGSAGKTGRARYFSMQFTFSLILLRIQEAAKEDRYRGI